MSSFQSQLDELALTVASAVPLLKSTQEPTQTRAQDTIKAALVSAKPVSIGILILTMFFKLKSVEITNESLAAGKPIKVVPLLLSVSTQLSAKPPGWLKISSDDPDIKTNPWVQRRMAKAKLAEMAGSQGMLAVLDQFEDTLTA
jgi:hypothetical protein